MLTVRKGNKLYEVNDNKKKYYLDKGWSIVELKGEKGKQKYVEVESAKKTLEQEVKALRKENKALKAKLAKQEATE